MMAGKGSPASPETRGEEKMSIRKKSGQVVMAVVMGIIVIGVLVLWVTTGRFHMMPMREQRPAKSETISAPTHGAGASHEAATAETSRGAGAGPEAGFRPDTDAP